MKFIILTWARLCLFVFLKRNKRENGFKLKSLTYVLKVMTFITNCDLINHEFNLKNGGHKRCLKKLIESIYKVSFMFEK